ncbi:molybdopterin-binding/glycosyltransferase family 2 protein [Shinella sp. CPCC 101442]|uniref:molybdopterin-binding/glycosyltransferase family 2 protein n=1 Tax=Shinella sp. CPCC 101442 TaxID=2932265 RepID=UPI002152D5DD|nr:molybdopterin-binding/glycosyltransferase family 2 protein [Shinella sp. CPCC 101442]MCR6499573.1 molybdopterin-binding/glycosyltransferase family 2 protein [Shinella sp. CPCC 101442]
MIFGEVPVHDAVGARLAHGVRTAGLSLHKGHVITTADRAALVAEGVDTVIAVRLDAEDIGEDEAASLIAAAIAPDHLAFTPPATGRINLHAAANGLFVADRAAIDRFNRVDPSITIATLPDHASVTAGDMVATIKIIPLAVPDNLVRKAAAVMASSRALEVKPFVAHRVGLVATELPTLKTSVMDKTRRLVEQRLHASGSRLTNERRVPHRTSELAAAIVETAKENDLVLVFGASAVTDANDVIPAAIRAAGGVVEHVGMPVDPGNLLVLGRVGTAPVIGAPGCARSPKENGFDWVLARIFAGEKPGPEEITGMGVGGLLKEIPSRPQPRDLRAPERSLSVAALVLAAGRASRMNGSHKLLAAFDGQALVRRSVEAALAARPARVLVVTGHRADEIEAELAGLAVDIIRNPDHAQGMSTSLRAGVSALGPGCDGVAVMLADMPHVTGADVRRLLEAFVASGGQVVVRAVSGGKRGNPVILPRSTFSAILQLEGDVGARHIVESVGLDVVDVEIGAAAHVDVDTPEAVLAAGGVLKG